MFDLEVIPFDHVILALADIDKPFPPKFIYRLSDITEEEASSLQSAWSQVALARRQAVMEDVQSMGEDDTLLDFNAVGRLALKDPDAYVRLLGIRTLTDYELVDLLPNFLYLVENDTDEQVRAACATALGVFVYLGEIEEISQKKQRKIEEVLLRVHQGSDTDLVRRRALEALGYSSQEEMIPLIERAYTLGERAWLVSALMAMGRSGNEIWNARVVALLDDRRVDVRAEAVTAAGELGIRGITRRLLELLRDTHDDVRAAAIWALSEVGGEGVRARLVAMQEESDDDDEVDLIESALENLSFTDDFRNFSILELDETSKEGEDEDEEDDFEFDDYDEDLASEESFDEDYDEDEDLG